MGKDVHKKNIQVAELGGITVVLGVVVSLLLFIGLETFYFGNDTLNISFSSCCNSFNSYHHWDD